MKNELFHSKQDYELNQMKFDTFCVQWKNLWFETAYLTFSSVHFSHSAVSDSVTSWVAAHQASLSITNPRSLLKLMSIESVMPSAISSSVVPFSSCPQFLPASQSFPMSQLFTWGGQSIGVSALASVLPRNTQDWSPLGWTGWISLQSKGLSRVFNTTVQKHQFFSKDFRLLLFYEFFSEGHML